MLPIWVNTTCSAHSFLVTPYLTTFHPFFLKQQEMPAESCISETVSQTPIAFESSLCRLEPRSARLANHQISNSTSPYRNWNVSSVFKSYWTNIGTSLSVIMYIADRSESKNFSLKAAEAHQLGINPEFSQDLAPIAKKHLKSRGCTA